jgi:hypothetical protein
MRLWEGAHASMCGLTLSLNAALQFQSCAAFMSGGVKCWGNNNWCQVGCHACLAMWRVFFVVDRTFL